MPDGVVMKTVQQSRLSSECFMVQIFGTNACFSCEYKNRPRLCGGKKIRATGKNENGEAIGEGGLQ